jgi:Fic family protein
MARKTKLSPAATALSVPVDPKDVARIESRNALLQFDAAMKMVDEANASDDQFLLRPSHLSLLNRIATQGVSSEAGNFRKCTVTIDGAIHKPPPWEDVQRMTEEACDYVNKNWSLKPIHLAAYLMWRINWIHPFEDGNGRTSRMISYVVLCVKLGFQLPGVNTIPDQIAAAKDPYYEALEAADVASNATKVDVGKMEELVSRLLAAQLLRVHDAAIGY